MKVDPPRFRLNFEGRERDNSEEGRAQQQAIVDALYALFGTPDEPYALAESGLNLKKLTMAAGPAGGDQSTGRHGLYRQHCVHCHGISGDGAGPTALFLRPYPRDYRDAKFKFTSTGSSSTATPADLRKIIHDGIAGTAMPSFALLPADEVEALTEYVKYLAIRGQTEFYIREMIEGGETLPLAREQLVNDALLVAVGVWKEAEGEGAEVIPPLRFAELADADNDGKLSRAEVETWLKDNFGKIDTNGDGYIDADEQVQPAVMSDPPITALKDKDGKIVSISGDADGDLKVSQEEMSAFVLGHLAKFDENQDEALDAREQGTASIDLGRRVFLGAGGCVKCHGPTGLGDNEEPIFDFWNDKKKGTSPDNRAELARLFTLPIQEMKPRNLRLGIYRGGRRPVDLYRRLHAGIKGTPMPALGPSEGNPPKFKSEDIWHLVDYVRSLPYEPISQPYGRQATVQPTLK